MSPEQLVHWALAPLEPYRRLDPAAWVASHQVLPRGAGLALALLGLLLLWRGGGRAFRLVAAPAGLLLGLAWTQDVLGRLPAAWSLPAPSPLQAGAALLVLGLLSPPALLFVAVGLPVGLLAGALAGPGDFALGFVPGLLAAGAVGALLHRPVAALLASAVGAWLLVLGALAALEPLPPRVLLLTGRPQLLVLGALLLALAAAALQLRARRGRRSAAAPSQEDAQARETAELQRRWGRA